MRQRMIFNGPLMLLSLLLALLCCFLGHVGARSTFLRKGHCGSDCTWDNDCNSTLKCSACISHKCSPGQSCGSPCSLTADCDQTSNCTYCNNQICSLACGQKCQHDKECVNYGCDACSKGFCVLWTCGKICQSDGDCASAYDSCAFCHKKDPSSGIGFCKSRCGSACVRDEQCLGRCPWCVNRTCSDWPPFSPARKGKGRG